jgi:hypothetical protein
MIPPPEALWNKFSVLLPESRIPDKEHSAFRKWLHYYLDLIGNCISAIVRFEFNLTVDAEMANDTSIRSQEAAPALKMWE